MITTILTAIAICCSFSLFSQTSQQRNTYFKLSTGNVSFGTGDYMGYSVSMELSKDLVKKPVWGLNKFLLGGELVFENGVKIPVIQNPSFSDMIQTFHHTSNILLWTKAAYYPFKSILPGFNIQLGPTIGYSQRSSEAQRKTSVDILGNSIRQSTLAFDNGFVIGYRISTGIEFDLSKKWLTGFRLDFSNNNQAEINTHAGLKLGYRF
jgi:hypothetical protein